MVERRATQTYAKENNFRHTGVLEGIVTDFSRQTEKSANDVHEQVGFLRLMAADPNAPSKLIPKKSKAPIVEKYLDYTISLGINDANNLDLNMSPEGKRRRQVMYDNDKA